MGGAEQAGAGGGAAKDTGPRTGATERDDTAAMPTVVGRSDQLASAVDRFTECLPKSILGGSHAPQAVYHHRPRHSRPRRPAVPAAPAPPGPRPQVQGPVPVVCVLFSSVLSSHF